MDATTLKKEFGLPILEIRIKRRKPGGVFADQIVKEVWEVLRDPRIVGDDIAMVVRGDLGVPRSQPRSSEEVLAAARQTVHVMITDGDRRNQVIVTQLEPIDGGAVWGVGGARHKLTEAVKRGFTSAPKARSFSFVTGYKIRLVSDDVSQAAAPSSRRVGQTHRRPAHLS